MGDVLDWLVPDATTSERAELRRIVTALRLVRDDARAPRAARVPSWTRARSELERVEREARLRAVEALLAAHLAALRGPDSFLEVGAPALGQDAAWRLLLADDGLRATTIRAALAPPAPLEPPASVVGRLVAAGVASGAGRAWSAWSAACLEHCERGPAEAERRWYALLRVALDDGTPPAWVARFLAGLLAARIERGDPARAWTLYARFADIARADPALRRLFGWSALACGARDAARALLADLAPVALPRALAELAADGAEWAELLRAAPAGPAQRAAVRQDAAPPPRALEPRALGAALLAVLVLRADGAAEPLALAGPPGERGERVERAAPLALARGFGSAEVQRLHAAPGATLAGALRGARTRALSLAALRDSSGEVRGWLQLECEHHLLPPAARLAALAEPWRAPVLAASRPRTAVARAEAHVAELCEEPYPHDDPREHAAARLLDSLGTLGALDGVRACWIELAGRTALVRATRGARAQLSAGPRRVLWRACDAGDAAMHDGGADERLHAGAAAGAALALRGGGRRVLGVLVLESLRAGPAPAALIASAAAALRASSADLWASAFRAATRAGGRERVLAPESRFVAGLEPALAAAASARAPLLLAGPRGSGRRTLAAWLHFRSADPEGALVEGLEPARAAARLVELAALDLARQVHLARALDEERDERVYLLAEGPASALREDGRLAPELERHLDPLPLVVPPLGDRRDEIPGIARAVLACEARRAGLAPATLEDGGAAALWRQDWRGETRELAALARQLARAHPGLAVGADEVLAALRARGLPFRERLPSRRPRPLDLELALGSTRHDCGTWNHARAARYLGWDPGTLAARLAER